MRSISILGSLILTLCFSSFASAQNYDGTGLDHAIRYLKNNIRNPDPDLNVVRWKIRCTSEQLFEINSTAEKVLELVRLTAQYGMEQVAPVNSRIAGAAAARLGNEAITITCNTPAGENILATAYSEQAMIFGYLLHNKQINLQKAFKSIRLLGSDIRSPFRQSNLRTIFHELLHLAKIDNHSTEVHNTTNTAVRQKDAVYTCAQIAFPGVYSDVNIIPACRTCYIATVAGAKTYLDEDKAPDATRYCERNF